MRSEFVMLLALVLLVVAYVVTREAEVLKMAAYALASLTTLGTQQVAARLKAKSESKPEADPAST